MLGLANLLMTLPDEREVGPLHNRAVGNLNKWLHHVLAAGHIARFISHIVNRDGAARARALVVGRAMPGERVVKVHLAFEDRASAYLDRMTVIGLG